MSIWSNHSLLLWPVLGLLLPRWHVHSFSLQKIALRSPFSFCSADLISRTHWVHYVLMMLLSLVWGIRHSSERQSASMIGKWCVWRHRHQVSEPPGSSPAAIQTLIQPPLLLSNSRTWALSHLLSPRFYDVSGIVNVHFWVINITLSLFLLKFSGRE